MRKRRNLTIDTAPPALLRVLDEFGAGGEWAEIRRRVRSQIPELREQSIAFDIENVARSDKVLSSVFDIHLHGALDLLSGQGCIAIECRIAAAERLARSLGLIADRLWLTDHLSTAVITMGRATNDAIDRLMWDAVAIAPLLPFIKAGIVRFRSPWMPTCSSCQADFENEVAKTAKQVLRAFRREFKIERRDNGGFYAHTGKSFEPPLVFHSYESNLETMPSPTAYAEHAIATEVRRVLWAAREASMTGGSVFTNSRIGLAGLLEREGRLPAQRGMLLFDKERELSIPWVSDLKPQQILQLREEASLALPAFRERLARSMCDTSSEKPGKSPLDLIAELREQAAEVRAELTAKRAHSARYWKTTYGVLGLALSAYGVATDQLLPGIAGLLPVIQLLIGHKTGLEADVAKLTTRPGYVLVKAQDILAHAH